MTTVHVLHEKEFSSNGAAFLFPLRFNQKRLRERGIVLRFFTKASPCALSCDVLCCSSKFFRTWWNGGLGTRVESFLQDARKYADRIFWFDLTDSTGTTQFRVLPFVNQYCKGQILRDRFKYCERYKGSRIFTDFAYKHFGVSDCDESPAHLNHVPTKDDLKKVVVGWNSGLAHYGMASVRLGRLWHAFPWLPRWYPSKWTLPTSKRSVPVSCRIGTGYARDTIAEPRRRIQELLHQRSISTEKLSRRNYFRELCQSNIAISPFGLGEITLRDFEIVISGSVMMKQDMSHLETWPNLWTAELYISFQWDLDDFDKQLDMALSDRARTVELAQQAQSIYRQLLTTTDGNFVFCERFQQLMALPA